MNHQLPPIQPMNGATILGQRQAAAQQAINQAVQQLSTGIYSHLAVSHLTTLDRPRQEAAPELLCGFATDSMVAAQAYFEGLGIAQFKRQPSDTEVEPMAERVTITREQLHGLLELAEECLDVRDSEYSSNPTGSERELVRDMHGLLGTQVPESLEDLFRNAEPVEPK